MSNTMTTALIPARAAARRTTSTRWRARRRELPRGVPGWLWLLGVSVRPLGEPDPNGERAWVVSAGAGPTGAAALFFATIEQDHDEQTREGRS